MRGMLVKAFVVVVGTVFLAGCFEPTDSTVQTIKDENSQLKAQVTDLNSQNTRLKKDASEARQAADLANVDAERWRTQYTESTKIAPGQGVSADVTRKLMEIGSSGKHWEYRNGVLRAQSDILFQSGSADLKPEAKAAIAEVAPKLKDILADKSIVLRVDGHTDSDKIVRTANLWKDNLHLSLMRARAVVEALKEAGVPADAVFAAGWGEIRPIPGAAKDKNRRVELVIVPAGQ